MPLLARIGQQVARPLGALRAKPAPQGGIGVRGNYPPKLTVEIAFSTDPLAVTPAYTDVSDYAGGVQTKRGRAHELGRVEAGTARVELDDADRRFDPLNTGLLTNLCTNPSFEVGLTGWTAGANTVLTVATPGSGAYAGSTVASFARIASTGAILIYGGEYAIAASTPYSASCYFYAPTAARSTQLTLEWRDAAHAYISQVDASSTEVLGSWVRVTVSGTSPSNAAFCKVIPAVYTDEIQEAHYVDAVQLEQAAAVSTYTDGSLDNCRWSGTAHASSSYRGGPYSPNVLPLKKVRITLSDGLTDWRCFTGFVERWPMHWQAPGLESEKTLDLVDGYEFLARTELATARATLTTSFGSNADLTFTAKGGGVGGNAVSIEYHIIPGLPSYHPRVSIVSDGTDPSPNRIRVGLANGSNSVPTSMAVEIRDAVNSHAEASTLVSAALAAGQNGSGIPTSLTRTYLSGGLYVSELSSVRVSNVLDSISWPTGTSHRSLLTGQSTVAAAGFIAQDAKPALDHVQETIEAEDGVFFIDGGGKAVFQDRHYRWKGAKLTPSVTFGDSGSEIPYEALGAGFDRDEIQNAASVSWSEATAPETYQDTANQATYGKRSIAQSLSLSVRQEAEARAQYLVEAFKNPKLRFDSISVMPLESATIWAAILPLEIGDRVTVKRRPPEHPAGGAVVISLDCFIESIQMTITENVRDAVFVFGLTPVPWANFWILGDSTYGVLGSTARLGY